MDKKTLNEITEKYDNTSPDQLRADLAVLHVLASRLVRLPAVRLES